MQKEKQIVEDIPEGRPVRIPVGGIVLDGDLTLPINAKGLVIFAHGSGSSRKSPRNQYVAQVLNEHNLGTLLTDLLTADEEKIDRQTRHLRFDISLLADRLEHIILWAREYPETQNLSFGAFGASTGAAAALIATARRPETVKAVVSRGGRPDLAMEFLPLVKAPALLIVGGHDPEVLHLNREALEKLNIWSTINVIPRATHLFEEPGALENVAQLAATWFEQHLE
ncbi:MAG: dienelactone hydrolase family protein [Micavibrio aeruginosavorus]|uniref:Dienelactone hydrolase family protein n=1 Tax=Micavibrio aeruginosavorus TaxID=349221 RepID=A0A7T5UHA4_9BACT|nr:MAG: dienelactone hydrolase family protein [Micavibrio aeruginosavorus]